MRWELRRKSTVQNVYKERNRVLGQLKSQQMPQQRETECGGGGSVLGGESYTWRQGEGGEGVVGGIRGGRILGMVLPLSM